MLFLVNFTFGQANYFKNYRTLADSLEKVYEIPACVILAVAYTESGGGTSLVAKKLNNHFGIVGDCNYKVSKHKSRYRYYATELDSYVGFCKLIQSKKYFETVKGSTDSEKWLKAIASGGYAQNPSSWAKTVNGTLKKYCK